MPFGKDVKGKHAPPPLPMYQPVVLKHVPTMVRRRYEKFDASKIKPNDDTHHKDEDLPTYDSGSEGDAEEIDACSPHDMDESEEDETLEIEHEFRSNEQGSASEDNSKNGGQSEMEHPDRTEVANVEEEAHGSGYESSGSEEGQYKSENYSLQDAHLSHEVDGAHVSDDCEVSMLVDDCKREDNSLSCEMDAGVVDDCRQSTEVHSINEDNTGALSKEVGNGCLPPTEDNRHEYDGIPVATHACDLNSNIENEARDKEDTSSDSEHGFRTGDSKSAANGAGYVKAVLETSVNGKAHGVAEGNYENQQGPPSEVSDSEGDGEDANPAASVDCSCEDKENGHTNVDDQQVIQKEKYTEDYGDDNNFITSSLDQDIAGDGAGAEDKDLHERTVNCHVNATVKDDAHQYYGNEQDFNPKPNEEGQDGEEDYELCCPICKQCITRTIIFHRRENDEHCRTTCFSWLLSLFSCIQ